MFFSSDDGVRSFSTDRDEKAIRALLKGLRGDTAPLDAEIDATLVECATLALFHGRRMGFATQDAFDALAAICLILGDRRREFFRNVFLERMMTNRHLSARDKLNRLVEIVIGTIPRPQPRVSNDNPIRESA